ncbi:MAG: hypothetical protein HY726_03170 [Candidatus Rokubacteria bacterium]|nr:hypothetical protein [Candidatus Rokubacteria bacterium]
MILAVALLDVVAFFSLNYLANHVLGLAESRLAYWAVVLLGPGMLLPAALTERIAASGVLERRRGSGRSEATKIAGALAAGALMAAFPIGRLVLAAPAHALRLSVWLFLTSLAEVGVFLGIVYNLVCALLVPTFARSPAVALAAVIASASFGLYHLTYAPPWNTLPMAVTLSLVWLGVTAVYLLTGSLWAAAVFNTAMAIIGFVLNDVTVLDREPLALGVLLDGVSLAAIIVTKRVLPRRLRPRPRS